MAVDLSEGTHHWAHEGTHGGHGSVFIRGAAAQVYACVKCNAGALSHVSIPPLHVTRMSSVNKNCCFCHSLSSSTHWPEDRGAGPQELRHLGLGEEHSGSGTPARGLAVTANQQTLLPAGQQLR